LDSWGGRELAPNSHALKIVLATYLLALPCSLLPQEAKRSLTVVDAIQSTRALNDYGRDPVLISPDGKKYLVVLQWGDVARNGSWVELLSGSTTTVEAASRMNSVVRLFSSSTAETRDLIRNVRWLNDNEHITFLWDDGQAPRQVVEVDIRTQQVRKLTRHSTPIVDYDVTADGQTIVFTAQAPHDLSRLPPLRQSGFAVTDQDIWSLLRGDFDGWTPRQHYETFVTTRSRRLPRKVSEPERLWAIPPELLQLSPDGRFAIAVRPAGEPPTSWDAYTEHMFKDIYLPSVRRHPGSPNWIRQYLLIDVLQATAKPLWDAPQNPFGRIVWSPTGRSVLIGPTFLPMVNADVAGLSGHAVAEVDIATGHFQEIPLPNDQPEYGFCPTSWNDNDIIELKDAANWHEDKNRLRFKKTGGVWRLIPEELHDGRPRPPVRFELRQDPNTPPALYAAEAGSGHERMIRDLNPKLGKEVTLGRVEMVHWKATDGRAWTGMLYYPVGYQPGQRHPFVIQTHGYLAHDFSLDGSFTTVSAAQPLANRGVAVLQVGGPDIEDENADATPREPQVFMAGCEGAIDKFVAAGLADRQKVGIIGFSRTGWSVEYLLTHSQFPLAAAEVADNIDGSYFQYVLGDSTLRTFYEGDKGAAPFGHGLEAWDLEAPGFNADKIHTPLRLELDSAPSASVLLHWEMFSNLRYLGKPVELFVIPDIEHGVHILQNPAQRLASQGGTVDWFTFWLKGEEDPVPAKDGQYARWRELRKLQHANEAGRKPN
jgi:dipeptidyl aminopeptidase/acylaminoacyl peptidase